MASSLGSAKGLRVCLDGEFRREKKGRVYYSFLKS